MRKRTAEQFAVQKFGMNREKTCAHKQGWATKYSRSTLKSGRGEQNSSLCQKLGRREKKVCARARMGNEIQQEDT
jgi:hypothetical protein